MVYKTLCKLSPDRCTSPGRGSSLTELSEGLSWLPDPLKPLPLFWKIFKFQNFAGFFFSAKNQGNTFIVNASYWNTKFHLFYLEICASFLKPSSSYRFLVQRKIVYKLYLFYLSYLDHSKQHFDGSMEYAAGNLSVVELS